MRYFSNHQKTGLRKLRVASGSTWILIEHNNLLRILPYTVAESAQKMQMIHFYLEMIASNWRLSGKNNQWRMIDISRVCSVSMGIVKRNAPLKLISVILEKNLIFRLKILRLHFRKLSLNCD